VLAVLHSEQLHFGDIFTSLAFVRLHLFLDPSIVVDCCRLTITISSFSKKITLKKNQKMKSPPIPVKIRQSPRIAARNAAQTMPNAISTPAAAPVAATRRARIRLRSKKATQKKKLRKPSEHQVPEHDDEEEDEDVQTIEEEQPVPVKTSKKIQMDELEGFPEPPSFETKRNIYSKMVKELNELYDQICFVCEHDKRRSHIHSEIEYSNENPLWKRIRQVTLQPELKAELIRLDRESKHIKQVHKEESASPLDPLLVAQYDVSNVVPALAGCLLSSHGYKTTGQKVTFTRTISKHNGGF